MRKYAAGAIVVASLLLSNQAYAENAPLKAAMVEARTSLATMLQNPAMRGADQQAVVKKTADAVTEMLATTKPPTGKEAAYKELVDTWAAFKKTREEELVPAIIAGKQADADRIGLGIQKERYDKMIAIVEAM